MHDEYNKTHNALRRAKISIIRGLKRHLTGRDPAVSFVCWLVPSTRHLRGPHRAGAYVSELGSQERMHKSCSRAQWWYTTVGVRTTIMELLLCPGLRLQQSRNN